MVQVHEFQVDNLMSRVLRNEKTGKFHVTYHDTDAEQQLPIVGLHKTETAAIEDAKLFVNS